jgi:hypothetical protein
MLVVELAQTKAAMKGFSSDRLMEVKQAEMMVDLTARFWVGMLEERSELRLGNH